MRVFCVFLLLFSGPVLFMLILNEPLAPALLLCLAVLCVGLWCIYMLTKQRMLQPLQLLLSQPGEELQVLILRLQLRQTLLIVTFVWLGSAIMFAYSGLVSNWIFGDPWLPLFGEGHFPKGHPLYPYGIFRTVKLFAGFLAISGALWVPVYFFFETISTRQKVATFTKRMT